MKYGARRRCGQIPAKMPAGKIDDDRAGQYPVRLANHQPKRRSERAQQQDIERKHVKIDGPVSQGQRLDGFPERHVQENSDVELVQVVWFEKFAGGARNHRDIDGDHYYVRGIEFESAL